MPYANAYAVKQSLLPVFSPVAFVPNIIIPKAGAPNILMLGDSISEVNNPAGVSWWEVATGFKSQVLQQCPRANFLGSGHQGDGTNTIAQSLQQRVFQYRPDIIYLEIGINQWARNDYQSILGPIRISLPTCQIACFSILWHNEQWNHGPPVVFSNGATDSTLYPSNIEIAALAAQYGCVYIDIRTQAALYEQAHNTPEPGASTGILTIDGIHPNTTGQLFIGTAVMAQTVFV